MAIDGIYNIEIDTPMGKQLVKLTLKAAETVLTGLMESSMGAADITDGKVIGCDVSWNVGINTPMGKMETEVKGTVTGGDISGTISVGMIGAFPFKGNKV